MSRTPSEDNIYDFDYLLEKPKQNNLRGRTYTLDEYGNPIRPRARQRVSNDNTVKLPPVLAGQSRGLVRPQNDLLARIKDEQMKVDIAIRREMERNMDWRTERNELQCQRQPQQFHYPYNQCIPIYSAQTDHSVQDKKLTVSRPPSTVDRRGIAGHVNNEAYRPSYSTEGVKTRPPTSFCSYDTNTRHERPSADKSNLRHDEDLHYQHRPYTPAPPAPPTCSYSYRATPRAPVPPTSKPSDNQSYSRNRRQLKYRKQELDTDFFGHKPTAPLNISKPIKHVPVFIDDFDREVKEAIEMENKFVALDDKVRKLKNECDEFAARNLDDEDVDNLLKDLDDAIETPTTTRSTSVAPAKCNMRECTKPTRMSTAATVHRTPKEPLKQWNGETAKRGVGFKSKLKRQEGLVRNTGDDIIPDRVRQKMNQYFKGSSKL